MDSSDHSVTVADVFRAGFAEYAANAGMVPAQHQKIADAIMDCRTDALGGMVYRCDDCAQPIVLFHSCRNRHCPQCQAMARAAWVAQRKEELPRTDYFHVVFTIPQPLKRYALRNKRAFYSLMFRAVSSALLELGADPKYLGGTIGIIAILHTWTQKMTYHPHIHCIVPAGALAPDGMEWVRSRGRFLFPAQVLRKLYRGKMMELFRESVKKGSIALEPEANDAPGAFRDMVAALYTEEWVVYLKESFVAPDSIIKYLASYINRIAISDKRIVAINGENVTFRYLDRTAGNTGKLLTIPLTKFISRFLLHAVPAGFVRIRYYGVLANRNRCENMARCRAAVSGTLELPADDETAVAEAELHALEPPLSFPVCPHCKSRKLTLTRELPRRGERLYRQVA